MPTAAEFVAVLHGIAGRIDGDASEGDVENAFLDEGFYEALGYEAAGRDRRGEWTLPDGRRPDHVTLDGDGGATAVYEFESPGRGSGSHGDRLFHYVDHFEADYGVLTDGEEVRVYRRGERTPTHSLSLSGATERQARALVAALEKPAWDVTDPERVTEFLDHLDQVALDGEVGRDRFVDAFRLEAGSPFADLVAATVDLLGELRDVRPEPFAEVAYDVWESTYAHEPDDVPDSWEPYVDGDGSLGEFVFCLESAHAVLARLLLAKATDDHDFFPGDRGLRRYATVLRDVDDGIPPDAYPVAVDSMMAEMGEQLVEGLFEDDVFAWWRDAYGERTGRRGDDPFSTFREVAAGRDDPVDEPTRRLRATRERFGRAMARVFFSVFEFDFSRVEGDPLGDLYQEYFDPETRKALGEFYTPQPVVEYVLDGVGYDSGVHDERLIDPSCGSGTFPVEAVRRYLDDVRRCHDDPDWERHLTELCTRPGVVGLDVRPFAVLMARIRFVVAILPEYREAKRANDGFTIGRLPILRTDTLRDGRELAGHDPGDDGTRRTASDAPGGGGDLHVPVSHPHGVGADADAEPGGDAPVERVRLPPFDAVERETGVSDVGEYFAAVQGVLDVVKRHANGGVWEYSGGLERGIGRYATDGCEGVAEFFAPYVDDALDTVRSLREERGDGRLFGPFEDSVLAFVLKNYVEYDYVVGNPPYVDVRGIPGSRREEYRRRYESAHGRFDLYVLFLERGLRWLSEAGTLGYVVPNKFTRSAYGREIRRIVGTEFSLASYVEFGDVDVFDDATNFACVAVVDRDRDRERTPYAKVHRGGEGVLDEVRRTLGEEESITGELECSTFPTRELAGDEWRFVPRSVRDVADEVRRNASATVGEVALGVRQGVSSGGDAAFVVTEADVVEHDLERELLLPIVRGRGVRRWIVEWDGEYAVYPYDEDGNLVDVEAYPGVKAYLDERADYLRDRYCVRDRNRGIYEYDGARPRSVFEGEFRIPTPDISTNNNFAYADGRRCFKNTAYVLTFDREQPYAELELLGLLNSSVSEFVVKQTSPPLRGRPFRYRYKTQYVEGIPLPGPGSGVESIVRELVAHERTRRRVSNFPNGYVEDVAGEIRYVEYRWQTARDPVTAEIETVGDGRVAVTAGRTDAITDPLMEGSTPGATADRAEYVRASVDGRTVASGELTRIPIPRGDEAVRALLDELADDREAVAATDVETLEAEVDRLVYDLFDLTDDERDVIEEYLDVF